MKCASWVRHKLREQWRDRDVAVVYAVLVIVISIIVAAQPPALLRDIVSGSSTNLVNLRQRPLAVLFASAFVVSPVWGLWIVAPMVVTYGALQRWLGRASVIVVAVLGHVGAARTTFSTLHMELLRVSFGREDPQTRTATLRSHVDVLLYGVLDRT